MELESFIIIDPFVTILVCAIFVVLGFLALGVFVFAPEDNAKAEKQILSMDCITLGKNLIDPNSFSPNWNFRTIDARELIKDQIIGRCLH